MLRLLFETLRPDAAVLTRIAGSRGLEVETLRAAAEKEAREVGLSVPMTVQADSGGGASCRPSG